MINSLDVITTLINKGVYIITLNPTCVVNHVCTLRIAACYELIAIKKIPAQISVWNSDNK